MGRHQRHLRLRGWRSGRGKGPAAVSFDNVMGNDDLGGQQAGIFHMAQHLGCGGDPQLKGINVHRG